MYRTQKFKIIESDRKLRNKVRIILVGFWITVLISTIIVRNITSFQFDLSVLIIILLILALLLPMMIKTYRVVGELLLTSHYIQIKKQSTIFKMNYIDISEMKIIFSGHFGSYPTSTYFTDPFLMNVRNGANNFIEITMNDKTETLEFLSRNSTDIMYLEKFEDYLKKLGLEIVLINEME